MPCNTIDSEVFLLRSPAKEFKITSGSPTKVLLAPESKQPFRLASRGSSDLANAKLELKKLLDDLFKPS